MQNVNYVGSATEPVSVIEQTSSRVKVCVDRLNSLTSKLNHQANALVGSRPEAISDDKAPAPSGGLVGQFSLLEDSISALEDIAARFS
jgi:hypothetical protein